MDKPASTPKWKYEQIWPLDNGIKNEKDIQIYGHVSRGKNLH